jgi:hypothetical protein
MRISYAILLVLLAQPSWPVDAAAPKDRARGADSVGVPVTEDTLTAYEAEPEQSEYVHGVACVPRDAQAESDFHTLLNAAPTPVFPIDARGCRPPPLRLCAV